MDMDSMDLDILTIMESVKLMLSQRLRLRLTPLFFTAAMVMALVTMATLGLDIMVMMVLDIMAMVWDIMAMLVLAITDMLVWDILAMVPTMASARLKQLTNTTSSSNNLNQTPIQSVICSSASF